MKHLKLNGWQRLWVVCVVFTLLILSTSLDKTVSLKGVAALLAVWIFFSAFVYGIGWVVGWVVRGFRKRDI